MNIIPIEEAHARVDLLKDRLGKPVDSGISTALAEFIRFTDALGFRTMQSCEGHIDWGCPFPWIDFEIPHQRVRLPPTWQFWRLRERMYKKREEKHHFENEEMKADHLCIMMTKYLVRYNHSQKATPGNLLRINRWRNRLFRLQPAYEYLSEGYKKSADHETLNQLLHAQRETFVSFASFCVEQLAGEHNLVGIPSEGCPGCMGRG